MKRLAEYLCPICKAELTYQQPTYACINNHCFDQAKEGYVNLLPVQLKHSKQPGDNKAMVNARRDFLSQGYYQPLVNKLLALQQEYALCKAKILDAGCGEGYYTHQHINTTNQVYGVDIAKEAIKKASKKYKEVYFSVATLSHLPFADHYFNWMISVYAPILEQEFTRVLAEQGYLVTVTPGKRHLFELKEIIYQSAKEHDDEKEVIQSLKLIDEQRIAYQMTLNTPDDALNLLSMTPFAFKASKEALSALSQQRNFNCQADFIIRLYQKI
ncbi:23S rRNA (guanine(745)-N(1))-methyltransferase [Thalassotalea profundi]|uniref:23S rRNA (Guanine(745)-N(1))-methyltransferase n=1 Tax=Thalassotalea profundi TaxID=2036687 RepID=A0ABQ3IP82_9GAMM|nr:23S rRNA (guanine(745)-N(1))-methyltransferase [Thalassotalea profundi]GHE90302.1 23S rRNA (guanine(745)-N(1))-methyltransferase [Thalassotalea profundi]